MSFPRNELYQFDEFVLDRFRRTLLREGDAVALSPKAFEVLTHLVANPGRVITKEELLKAVWPESFVEESNLAQHIYGLRKALADRSSCIVTVPGRGYQFTAPVQVTSQIQQASTETVFPESAGRDILVQRVRERTRVVLEESSPLPAATARPAVPIRTLGIALAAILIIAAVTALAWRHFSPPPKFQKVMITDFLNLTGDPSMDHPLSSALAIELDQTPYLQLMARGMAATTLAIMQKPSDTPLLGNVALEICRRNNFQAMLSGKIANDASGYDLTLQEIACNSGRIVAEFKANAGNKDALLDTLDELGGRVRKKLGEPNQSIDQFQIPLIQASTFSFEALSDYNIGSKLGNEGKIRECIPYFEKAVDIDPKFAMAHASLGTAYYNLGSSDKADLAYRKAFDLSGNVTQSEKFFIRSNYYLISQADLINAASVMEEWSKVYPNDPTTWTELSNLEQQLGNYPRAIEAGERALRTGYLHPEFIYMVLADSYKEANRFADAKRIIAEAQAQGKDTSQFHQILFELAMIEHDPETLQREAAWSKDKPEHYLMIKYQAYLDADQGKIRESEDLFHAAILEAQHDVPGNFSNRMLFDEADLEAQLGNNAKTAALLKQVQNHSGAAFVAIEVRAGNIAAGDAYLRNPEEYPNDTIEHYLRVPELKALVALAHHDAATALAALEPAAPYEVSRPEVMTVHAEAFLAAHQPQMAAAEYNKIIANPGVESPMLPRTVVAHLGLARALAMANDVNASRAEYEKFFSLWQDADPDQPILKQAHLEYAHL